MKIRFALSFLLVVAISSLGFAQENAETPPAKKPIGLKLADPEPTADKPAAAEAPPEMDSHAKAIEEFLLQMKMDENTESTINQMLAMQVQQNPQMAVFSDVMRDFLQKHLAFDVVKYDLIEVYRDVFTEAEIKELTEFYQTPIGMKAADKLPMLAAAAAQIEGRRVQANMGELQAAMAKRQAELQAKALEAAE
jgi:uncharacterized protein